MLRSQVALAKQTLLEDLVSLEEMIQAFSEIFELGIVDQAKQIRSQLDKVTEVYFQETWDSSEAITASLDLTFSELEFETSRFSRRVDQLDESLGKLAGIYAHFVLSQALVMLVSSLEVYLTRVFRSCLSDKRGLNERAIRTIMERYNFQNWGSSVDAFQTFFEVDLVPEGVNGATIERILQKRHVFVHQMGTIDEKAARKMGLHETEIGKHLKVSSAEILEGVQVVREISKCLSSHFGQI